MTPEESFSCRCDFGNDGLCVRCGAGSSGKPRLLRYCPVACPQLFTQQPQPVTNDGDAISAPPSAQAAPPTHGPGTELKKLLAMVGITSAPDCACNARAAEMDAKGGEWCEANIDTIVGWLREQATARGLPFLDAAGKMLVKRAIRNAARLTQ